MPDLAWYRHRLAAMSAGEVAWRALTKLHQITDALRPVSPARIAPAGTQAWPTPPGGPPPQALAAALARDTRDLLAGRWSLFGGSLDGRMAMPPAWQRDVLAEVDLTTTTPAFRLDPRQPPGGADVRVVWEINRWSELVRLAQSARALGHAGAATTCREWLAGWLRANPPYHGWNWTSALESALRLVNFTWLDALLCGDEAWAQAGLAAEVLPSHMHFTWRYRSRGSSANNHLLGELSALLIASSRWPELARWSAALERLVPLWEDEVLAQFAPDGGNREQALHYHLFAWELCLQALLALRATGRAPGTAVSERLEAAADFFSAVQVAEDPWDYGDSDDATVTPLYAHAADAPREWIAWTRGEPAGAAIAHWLGSALRHTAATADAWQIFRDSGIAVYRSAKWDLRLDASPLGYLSTAAHGHLDALHLSIWRQGVAIVIDPGTGAYYADAPLRAHLASAAAHNGPHPDGDAAYPRRLGPFLWSAPHEVPRLRSDGSAVTASWKTPAARLERRVERDGDSAWRIEDRATTTNTGAAGFTVLWQLAPDTNVERLATDAWRLRRGHAALVVRTAGAWTEASLVRDEDQTAADASGLVSPGFRRVRRAPYLRLRAAGGAAAAVGTTRFEEVE